MWCWETRRWIIEYKIEKSQEIDFQITKLRGFFMFYKLKKCILTAMFLNCYFVKEHRLF
ncbi:MAG: hypothetical protein PWQ37_1886 [Candidatus Petromonas sp.]|jgi:hypothetical protein|nr:hypothetical protein [Candidatus Petromonas sp.]